jgi:hypothetical protein
MPTHQEHIQRQLTGAEHWGTDRQQTGRDPNDAHSFSFYQLAVLLAKHHRVAVVPSHGVKENCCTCGEGDCERPGAHPRTLHKLQDATTDLRLIGKFWEKWPKAKVIIATGLEGVIAVTVKGPKGKLAFKEILGDEDEASLETLQFFDRGVRTYVWRTAATVMPEGEILLADGLTAHGQGSFVIVPKRARNVNRRPSPLFQRDVLPAPASLLTALGVPTSALPAPPLEPEQDELIEPDLDLSGYHPTYEYDEDSPETLKLNLFVIDFDWIEVPDGVECDEKKVRALAESYEITGPRHPLVVRLLAPIHKVEGRTIWPKLRLVSDLSHFEALKRHGITCADCWVIIGDEADERLWKLAELIHQPERKRLDWAHLVMEWVAGARAKGVQVAHPPGDRQPHDKGMSAAEKVLGISRRDLGRAERIANICPDAQAVIRQAKLDDIQVALEEIAGEPPQRQVEKALELKERYRKPRRNRARNGDAKPDTAPTELPKAESPDIAPGDPDPDEGTEDQKPVEGPDTAPEEPPGDVDPPSALDRRVSADDKFEIVKSQWEQYIADDWEDLSEQQQVRFAKEVQGFSVVVVKERRQSH